MASQQLSSAVQWSTAQKAVQRLVPPLSFDSRKGQNGRIGVLGGSYELVLQLCAQPAGVTARQ